MLASITPLGERGRHATWGVTITAFALSAIAAATALGALTGELGSVVIARSVSSQARLIALACAVLVAIVLDVTAAVPGPRRQVNERWLHEYRGWVYGVGYGAQLGVGVTTVISSAATYVALVAAFLTESAGAGAIVMGCFGAVRGLTPLAASGVRTPGELLAVHRVLSRLRGYARWGGVGVLGAILVLALVGGGA
jgi:sulfite exporter TauE/SafE